MLRVGWFVKLPLDLGNPLCSRSVHGNLQLQTWVSDLKKISQPTQGVLLLCDLERWKTLG